MIKLLIGGSPCTFWSIAQKNHRETTAEGMGWELFKNYLIAREKFQPDFFLYENNKSADEAIKDMIKEELDVTDGYQLDFFKEDIGSRYIEINSALVSAQNRQRFYVHNCGEVEQPKDREILLTDILEKGIPFRGSKSFGIDASYYKGGNLTNFNNQSGRRLEVAEPVRIPDYGNGSKARPVSFSYSQQGPGQIEKNVFPDNTNKQKYDYVAEQIPLMPVKEATAKGYTEIEPGDCVDLQQINSPSRRGRNMKEKCNCLTTSDAYYQYCGTKEQPIYEVKDGMITIKDKQYPIKLVDGFYIIRKLTVTECCRLQTMPDDYCRAVSDSQAYKGLGNGWTAEVIIHILSGALNDIPRDEEIVVLSMYDGIGTGRYCLDKMGFKNVKYFAYEIDKYAMQIAKSNYPDIIHMGDAFALREDDWKLDF